ncbi:penicillin-binding protein activator [Telluria mixta]|uniref:Penicillin-binding protein activator n=1 Tax=Telluria mixta TaxID=34071 RepID=A0ABT2C615_9BURK|nr:penicillin-binding protein activator [Telluria mixta]MCS0632846.1 penicillin-binding protein activator [Telluria mixta]WEM97920.1 penicillin-binding protein activator [Telluria mixta]
MKILEALCARLAWLLILMSLGGYALAGTPCAGPQRLCASVDTNTSAPAPLLAMLDPAIQPRPARPPPNEPAPPPPPSAVPIRIALLLPMRSATLATAAEAVRAGFMAGMERDGTGFKAEVVSTGDAPRDVLDAYARAAVASDIIVGPLARSAVAALADSDAVTRPTVVLSVPEGRTGVSRTTVPRGMLVVGLSIEDEARQVADWAAREHPHGRALILTGGAAWAQRAAGAFEGRWVQLGHTNQRFAVPSGEGGKAAIEELKQKLEIDPPDLLFAALDSTALRPVRALAAALPCYGGGPANPGRSAAPDVPGLDGVRLLDLPWIVLPDHPAVMVYPRPLNTEQPLDMDRLYALGIDAFRVARELALRDGAPFGVDGVTGRLDVVAGPGGQLQLQRVEAAVVVRGGAFEPVDKGR